MDVFAFANLAKDLGFSLLIADNLPLHVLSASERQRLLEHVKKLNLSVEVGTRGIQSEHLKTYLQLAKTFNSRILPWSLIANIITQHQMRLFALWQKYWQI